MKFFFTLIFLMIATDSYAHVDYRENQILGRSCDFFLSKLKPEDFRINILENEKETTSKFSKNIIKIVINRPLEETWKGYLGLNLEKFLNSDISQFCRLYTPPNVQKENNQHLFEGMRFFANMLFNSPTPFIPSSKSMTAIEIKKIDHDKKRFEISYLEGTPTKGWQTIQMVALGNKTQIIHTSFFKGNNNLIHTLYESVHELIWEKIHAKAKRAIEKGK